VFFVQVLVKPPRQQMCKYLIGKGGARTQEIAKMLETELMNLFHCDIKFSLGIGSVKCLY
jgi:hypothetical protein